jgi:hypothetical protein
LRWNRLDGDGYATHRSGTSLLVHGKYVPRLFFEYFAHGVRRTFLCRFDDPGENPDSDQDNYGLVRHDGTPKPAYRALRNVLGLLRDEGTRGGLRPLDIDVRVHMPPGFDREKASESKSDHRVLSHPDVAVTASRNDGRQKRPRGARRPERGRPAASG